MRAYRRLLNWYDTKGRDLPWRRTRDPYRILVSEIMLQQTQVSRVKDYYQAWLKEFPDWQALANASNAEVIHAWSGLGYNRRALMLRDIAQQVVERGVPQSGEEWMELKGVGPYTSAALVAFSLHKRILPIDTNIRRTVARILLGTPYPTPKDDDRILEAAEQFLPKRGRYYDVPQALFDLATDICKKTPECARCPMRNHCLAAEKFLSGEVVVPKRMIKKPKERKHRNKRYPDRIYRGRILKIIKEEPGTGTGVLGSRIDPTFDQNLDTLWVLAMVERMKNDRLLTEQQGALYLYGSV